MKRIFSFKNILIYIIIIVSYLPLLYYWLKTPSGMIYTFAPNYDLDYPTYVFKMNLGENGKWLFQNYYVLEDTPKSIFYFFYIILGHISSLLHLSPLIVYHIVKIILSFFLLDKFFKILKIFFTEKKSLLLLFFISTLSLTSFQFEIFQTIKDYPHLVLSLYLYLCIIYIFFSNFNDVSKINFKKLASILLIIVWVAPYMIFPVNLLYIILLFKRFKIKDHFINLIYLNSLAVIFDLYVVFMFNNQASESWVSQSNLTIVTNFSLLVKVFLPFFIPLFFGIVLTFKKLDLRIRSWILMFFIFICIPTSFQARTFAGMLISILMVCFYYIDRNTTKKIIKQFFIFYMAFMYLLCMFFNINIQSQYVEMSKHSPTSLYMDKDINDIYKWFNRNGIKEKRILSNIDIGLWIPSNTFNRTYAGHYSETYFLDAKLKKITKLKNEQDLNNFIKEQKIDYIISFKKQLIKNKNKDYLNICYFPILNNEIVQKENYIKLYENDSYIIYKTN
jgi:hypothetical protein